MTADPAAPRTAKAPANHRARATALEETIELRGARSGAFALPGSERAALLLAVLLVLGDESGDDVGDLLLLAAR